jgi:hypothetical protein
VKGRASQLHQEADQIGQFHIGEGVGQPQGHEGPDVPLSLDLALPDHDLVGVRVAKHDLLPIFAHRMPLKASPSFCEHLVGGESIPDALGGKKEVLDQEVRLRGRSGSREAWLSEPPAPAIAWQRVHPSVALRKCRSPRTGSPWVLASSTIRRWSSGENSRF